MSSAEATHRGTIRLPARAARAPATVVLGLLLGLGAIFLLLAGRHLTFFYDEWSFIISRRGGSLDAYLSPHNGHLVLFPVIVYKLLFAIVGLRHYLPYQIVGVALHVLCCGLLYVLARRRVGPWVALAPTTLLLLLGSAWQDLLWPFQIGYFASIAGGLGALLALDDPERPRNGLVAALLTWAVVSSGVGLAFVVACGALVIARRDPWIRLWPMVVPIVIFGIWYVGWSTGESTSSDALLAAPQYVATAAASATAGIAGLDQSWGAPLVIGLLLAVAIRWQRRAEGGPTPMLLAAGAGMLTFWVLAAITRAELAEPTASRYVYIGATFILLLAMEARLGASLRGAWALVAALAVIGAVVANLHLLRAGERALRASDTEVRASMAAVELAAPVVAPSFVAAPVAAPQLSAAEYLPAVRDLGSPAYSLSELERAPEGVRLHTDGVLTAAEGLALIAPAGASSGALTNAPHAVSGRVARRGACTRLIPNAAAQATFEFTARPGTRLVFTPGQGVRGLLSVRRLAADYPPTPFPLLSDAPRELVLPPDRAPQLPWSIRISTAGPIDVCA